MRWIIVSNRLPFRKNEDGELTRSSGGLVTALSGVKTDAEQLWVGIAPESIDENAWQGMPLDYQKRYQPVFVDDTTYDAYYNGIANDVFWPLFHYEGSMIKFSLDNWQAYQRVNDEIAKTIAEHAKPDDVIWIHDFHLFLLPQMLKDLGVTCRIGFFLHIPFPSSELFRQLPIRHELLQGVMGADLIGFHDYSYARHFANTLNNVMNIHADLRGFWWQQRRVEIGVYPVSIDSEHFRQEAASAETQAYAQQWRIAQPGRRWVLGVDRLDYTKGLVLKLQIFADLLENHPQYRGEVSLLQLAIPTRQEVDEYQKLRSEVERMVGEINGKYSTPGYTPVQYMYTSIPLYELLALYRQSAALLVTSRRDGMNLVALEYVVSQGDEDPGVVVLSEFTGAASMLSEALLINPWDIHGSADILAEALGLSLGERQERKRIMQDFLSHYNASDWAESFMRELLRAGQHNEATASQHLFSKAAPQALPNLLSALKSHVYLFLDYDGTLVPIQGRPEQAVMPASTRALMARLLAKENLTVVIVSGRDGDFLQSQFEGLPVMLAAEHGAKFYDPATQAWTSLLWSDVNTWYAGAKAVMENYTRRVPRSHVEPKEYAIAWHYRQSPRTFSNYQAHKLKEDLESGLTHLPATVIAGNKVIEARAVEANKGYFVRNFLTTHPNLVLEDSSFIALGDDTTDDDMMRALPEGGLGIKVGEKSAGASHTIDRQQDVLSFLQELEEYL
jgi:trehalose 6-phosphate synthase/phosphatase